MTDFILPHIAASTAYVPGAQPLAPRAKLNTNESPYPPSPKVRAAIRRSLEGLNRYPEPHADALVAAAAAVYGVPTAMVMACNGGDEALAAAIRAIVGPGDEVAMLRPTYPFFATLVSQQGGRCVGLAMSDVATGPPPNTKLSVIARPNSPCGRVVPRAVIAAWRGPLIVDEAYVEFGADSVVDLLRSKRDLLIVRTLSKAYGLAGLRVGFLLGHPDVLHEIGKVRGVYTVDRVAAAAGIAALGDSCYLQRTVARVAAQRRRLIRDFAALGVSVEDNPVNFIWTRMPHATRIAAALGAEGIHVRCFGDALRITVGTRDEVATLSARIRRIRVAQADAAEETV